MTFPLPLRSATYSANAENQLPCVYRADGRSVEQIKREGFVPWYRSMRVEDLRELVRVYAGTKTLAQSSLGAHLLPKAGLLAQLDAGSLDARRDAAALHRHIINSPTKGPFVSTDPDRSCGGYTGRGTIYRIDMRSMQRVEWARAVPGARKVPFMPHLLIDAETVDRANHFALHAAIGSTREITFIGPIPASWIEPVVG
ncbi:hypothetical protein [Luteibacter sp. CQ10]|uniref:hypothetical protein n=1 Tax=Luteibacter sp. CQ10 TaxID=2805821 RepID=UPI0034A318BF